MNASFKRLYGNQAPGAPRDGHGRDAYAPEGLAREGVARESLNREGLNREGLRSMTGTTSETRLRDIAQSLDTMVSELQLLAERSEEGVPPIPTPPSFVERAKQVYRNRRRREQVFGDTSLFGEPAWDIMLDLYVAAVQDKRIAVTSACIGSAVPATTALRWIKILEDRGLIEREVDEVDARRTFVRLSPRGCDLMEEYLAG
jgi:predicted transcriptional regulator